MPFADLNGTRLHYSLSGARSSRVIVLAHSLGATCQMWQKIVPALASQFRVLQYDCRGHGSSSVSPAPYTLDELGNDLVALLDHLGIEHAHFCGLSLGGMVGMWLGIHEARRVDGLVLANTAARIGTREGWDERIATVRRSGLAQLANATLERWFTAPFRQGSLQEMDTIRTMIASTPPEGYVGCCAALRDGDLRPQVGTIRARTLVIAGSHDPATTPEDGRRLHEAVPNSSYVELETAHLSAWERPEEFQRAVLDFLR